MHVGMAAIFQNPDHEQGTSDYAVYQKDMKLALMAEGLGFDSVWGIEHHFTDYTMMPDVVDFLSFVGGACRKVKLGTMVVVLPWNDPMRVAEKNVDARLHERWPGHLRHWSWLGAGRIRRFPPQYGRLP